MRHQSRWSALGFAIALLSCRASPPPAVPKPNDELAGVLRLRPKIIGIHGQSPYVSSTELVFSQPLATVLAALPGNQVGTAGPIVVIEGKRIGSRFLWRTPKGMEIAVLDWHGVEPRDQYFPRPEGGECELDVPGDMRPDR